MRGFFLWAPDRPNVHYSLKTVSNPFSSQNLLTFLPWYGSLPASACPRYDEHDEALSLTVLQRPRHVRPFAERSYARS
jgi:hypothetical protein